LPAEAAPSFLVLPDLPPPGERMVLPEDESRYVSRVCRVRPGERVSATDGRGGLAVLRVLDRGPKTSVEVESCERARATRAAWVLAGAPEGERGDWLVEKLAELGVTVFQPVDCQRGAWARAAHRHERWQRLAVAALRQSRRRFRLDVRTPLPLDAATAGLPDDASAWLADADGPPASGVPPPPKGVAIGLVGPAAGLSPAERDSATARGFHAIALSDSRLRSETATLAWACWWSAAVPAASNDAGSRLGA